MSQIKNNFNWPELKIIKKNKLFTFFQVLFDVRFIKYVINVVMLLVIYLFIIFKIPTLQTLGFVDNINVEVWWPFRLFLLVGSSAKFGCPGLASVGLLGGVLIIRSTNVLLKKGHKITKVIFRTFNLVYTFIISVGLTLIYKFSVDINDLYILFILLATFFLGSLIVQLLNAAFYRKTKASLFLVNFIYVFKVLIDNMFLSNLEIIYIIAIISFAVIVSFLYRLSPFKFQLQQGELPRKETMEEFSSIDYKWFSALCLWTFILTILGDTLGDLFLDINFPFQLHLILSFLLLNILLWYLYKLNNKTGIYFEIDIFRLKRKMESQYLTIKDVNAGHDTKNYLNDLNKKAQKHVVYIFYILQFFCLPIILFLSSREQIVTIISTIPFFVFFISEQSTFIFNSFSSFYNIISNENTSDIKISSISKSFVPMDSGIQSSILSGDQEEQKLYKIIDFFGTSVLTDNDVIDIKEYVKNKDKNDNISKFKLLVNLIKNGIPLNENQGRLTLVRAKKNIIKLLKNLFYTSIIWIFVLTFTIKIIDKLGYDTDPTEKIIFIFGPLIANLLAIVRQDEYKNSITFISTHWYRKLKNRF